jgi:choloylglycine hydrolase
MKRLLKLSVSLSALLLLSFTEITNEIYSPECTGITLNSADGAFIQARTMEWGAFDMKPELLVFPRNYKFESLLPDNNSGLKWNSTYGFIGINGLGKPIVADGMNEEGLTVSVLYLPHYASYQPYEAKTADSSINQNELASWLLGTCKSTQQVRTELPKIRVVPLPEESIGGIPTPIHFMVSDKKGESIIIEYTEEQLHIYDNSVGVLTNSPPYPWHLTNLNNYVTLGVKEAKPVRVGEIEIKPLGAGSGMLGLPGDYTPPSRFIRATAMRNTVPNLENGERAVAEAFRILNNFDIPIGTLGGKHDPAMLGDTQYTTVANTKSLHYYYRTMHNHRIRVVDLKTIDFTGNSISSTPLDEEIIQDYKTVLVKPKQ